MSNSLQNLGFDIKKIGLSNLGLLEDCDLIVLPGTGNFGAATSIMRRWEIDSRIRDYTKLGGPVLGLCLGMQLLFDSSEESPGSKGLGLIGGSVNTLPTNSVSRVHIGWSETVVDPYVAKSTGYDLLEVYYVHSYHCRPIDSSVVTYVSNFAGSEVVAGVRQDNLVGLQFHPEKSSKAGSIILRHELRRLLA